MSSQNNFPQVFERLKAILSGYQDLAVLTADNPENYMLNTGYVQQYKKELFLGGVQIKKNYVSYHLMPVYMYPDLLENVSPQLKKRMQGKSCFNFKQVDETLFQELGQLTQRSVDRLRAEQIF
jgi:hypothetical protein